MHAYGSFFGLDVVKVAYTSATACIVGYAGYRFVTSNKKTSLAKAKEAVTSPTVVKSLRVGAAMTALSYFIPSYQKHLACIGIGISLHGIFDAFIASRSPARWWILHAYGNAGVVVMGCPAVLRCVLDPVCTGSVTVPFTRWPMYIVGAVHLYHTIAFEDLSVGDWVHHILFAGTIVPMGLTFNGGPGTSLIAFFISGLPGGIDYVMLALTKHKLMEANTEKRLNARVNVWLRAPGTVLVVFCYYVSFVYGERKVGIAETTAAVVAMILVFMNGQYYMQRVVGNAYLKDEKINKVGC